MKREIEQTVRDAVSQTKTMRQAAVYANMAYGTFISRAKRLGVYAPNQSRKGMVRKGRIPKTKIPLQDILDGKHPQYKTYGLKRRLWKEGVKEEKCEQCGILAEWDGKHLALQLDHIDRNNRNHVLNNLRILCPNCHSQTKTYCGKNSKGVVDWKLPNDVEVIELYKEYGSIRGVLDKLTIHKHNRLASNQVRKIVEPYIKDYFKRKDAKTPMVKPREVFFVSVPDFTKEELQELLWKFPLTKIGKKFDKSDNAIKRWVKKWELSQPPRGYFLRKT